MHERLTLLMQAGEDKLTPCINELPALVASEPHLQGQSDDSIVGSSPANTFPKLSNFINSLPPTAQACTRQEIEARPARPPAQSMGEMWCQYAEEAHDFSMNNVNPKSSREGPSELDVDAAKRQISLFTNDSIRRTIVRVHRQEETISPTFRSPAINNL